jgi:hypothetical protein
MPTSDTDTVLAIFGRLIGRFRVPEWIPITFDKEEFDVGVDVAHAEGGGKEICWWHVHIYTTWHGATRTKPLAAAICNALRV